MIDGASLPNGHQATTPQGILVPELCRNVGMGNECVVVDWPGADTRLGFVMSQYQGKVAPRGWMGSLPALSRDGSGQMYRRNRYYEPNTGRFTQEDPIGLAGGVNSYGFADGDPVSYADPYGLDPCTNSSAWTDCLALAIANWGGERHSNLLVYTGAALSAALEVTGINAAASAGDKIGNGQIVEGGRDAVIVVGGTYVAGKAASWIGRALARRAGGAVVAATERGGVFAASADAAERVPVPGNPFRGPDAAQRAFAHLQRFSGLDPAVASNRLHRIKAAFGLRPAENAIIGRTGDVYHPYTGERLGSLTDPHWGGAKR
jgi:RHS repeat-associated protein